MPPLASGAHWFRERLCERSNSQRSEVLDILRNRLLSLQLVGAQHCKNKEKCPGCGRIRRWHPARHVVLRAARSPSHGQTHTRTRLNTQPLQWAMRLLLGLELLGLRR
eukprot:2165098-Prymnesium_polylepis.1